MYNQINEESQNDKEQTQKKYENAIKQKRKKFPMYKRNKRMLKVKNLIKNTPSKLHHMHKRRGVLRAPSNI